MVQILTEPKNAMVKQYAKLLSDGRAWSWKSVRAALKAIARKALNRKTGARGLRSILEQSLIDTMFELPNIEQRRQGGGRRIDHRRKQAPAARLPRSGEKGMTPAANAGFACMTK
jgi:ATP-dependent protease Clp ATPase subunit